MVKVTIILDEDDNEYIAENRETEAMHSCKSAQQIQATILQDLHQTMGVDVTLLEPAAKELVLQVLLMILQLPDLELEVLL